MNYIDYMNQGGQTTPYDKVRDLKQLIIKDRQPMAQMHYFDVIQYLKDVIFKIKNFNVGNNTKVSSNSKSTDNTPIPVGVNNTGSNYAHVLSSSKYSGVDRFTPLASE